MCRNTATKEGNFTFQVLYLPQLGEIYPVVGVPRVWKIVRKSSAWWKHGRHKGQAEIAMHFNRLAEERRKRRAFEPLDLSRPDWSRRKK